MAWRPYDNLINGELDNSSPGKVTGWMRFFRNGQKPLKVVFDLTGDFHEDIRGKVIRLSNPDPSDHFEDHGDGATYMEGFSAVQRGSVGDITAGRSLGPWSEELSQKLMARNELAWDEFKLAGSEREARRKEVTAAYRKHIEAGDLFYPYVDYPYIEWYSDNGRVVLELEPAQLEVCDMDAKPLQALTPKELRETERERAKAFGAFMSGMVEQFSNENRRNGGDGNVFGAVI